MGDAAVHGDYPLPASFTKLFTNNRSWRVPDVAVGEDGCIEPYHALIKK